MKIIFLPVCLFLLLSVFACSRTGCNNIHAENYEPKASKSCYCCYYAAEIRIWSDTKPSAINKSISVYIDGELVRENISSDILRSYEPNTSFLGVSSVLDDSIVLVALGNEEKKVINLRVVNQSGNQIFADTTTVRGGYLTPVKIKLQ